MHLQCLPRIFLRVCGTLTTLYLTLHMLLFECMLSLYGHTMHVPTLQSIFQGCMVSLYGSIMHVAKLEPHVQALFLALKFLHFSSAQAWATSLSPAYVAISGQLFLLSVSVANNYNIWSSGQHLEVQFYMGTQKQIFHSYLYIKFKRLLRVFLYVCTGKPMVYYHALRRIPVMHAHVTLTTFRRQPDSLKTALQGACLHYYARS